MTAISEPNVTMSYHLLSKKDVAKFLGYTIRTLDRLIASGRIPYVAIPTGQGRGRKIKFDSRAIDAWVAENGRTAPAKEAD